jgi:two-component system alkaline phosphatase synthesis response regulator PhoP
VARKKILVIEDDEDILELLTYNLTKDGYQVEGVASGEEGLSSIRKNFPDLVLLDLMLPGVNGLDFCRQIKSDLETRNIPIVMLTARGEEADIVSGLELGADDYITKPFSTKILLARIRTVLRRKHLDHDDNGSIIRIHELVINPQRHEVLVSGKKVELTSTEFRLLHFLTRRPGWVFTRAQLVEAAHGINYPVTDRSIDFQIVGLRKKLGPLGKYIETIRGVGYRFQE